MKASDLAGLKPPRSLIQKQLDDLEANILWWWKFREYSKRGYRWKWTDEGLTLGPPDDKERGR